jgi:4-hydroxybenzoate polyprenyltransferase/phosphoserine phosphatase
VAILPLVVDLDGTLILTDTLHEQSLVLAGTKPWLVPLIPIWLLKGKAALKFRLVENCASFSAEHLPYNVPFLDWLKQEKSQGRTLILCTATNRALADEIANHLGVFDDVIASDHLTNIAGENKATALVAKYGASGFDYAGNSSADLPVWAKARQAIVVNASQSVTEKTKRMATVEKVFPTEKSELKSLVRAIRPHQWLKNALLAVPLLAAHQIGDLQSWFGLLLAFIAFSLCASSVYIANDLLDLESDRQHPRKRYRPFASGQAPIWKGVLLAPILLVIGFLLATQVGGNFLAWLAIYFLLTCAYSWLLKRLVLIDCLTLAMLYTLRIVAGASAAGLAMSYWLLAFSVFLFLSLAFVKRYAELQVQQAQGKTKAHGRGYVTADAPLVQSLGVSAGYAAVIVLALYLHSDKVVELYRAPDIVWGAVIVVLFWISWMWLRAHRGQMHDDPLVFAVKDKGSLLAAVVFGLILLVGTQGLPPW